MSQVRQAVLIVDDEQSVRHTLSAQLEELRYESEAARSGLEALEKLAGRPFDLVMLDVRMPGMSGSDTLGRIRADDAETCVVMLSGVVDSVVAAEAIRLGADDYITKPCSLDYLESRLRSALARRARARQGVPAASSVEGVTENGIDLAAVTRDLVHQQIALFEQVTRGHGLDDHGR